MEINKYSVLMSVYHEENPKYFKVSIESMVNQSLIPDQIVIVKDGKLTKELDIIVNKYVLMYPNLFTIVSFKKNKGLGIALNKGLVKCRNELVARMDTDDISNIKRCETQINKFNKNKRLSIVGSFINEFNENPNEIISTREVPLKHEDILKFSRKRNPFNHPSVMYKKNDVLKIGGYGDFRRNQDLDLFVRMLNHGYQSCNINQPLLLFRANEDNLKRRKSWKKSVSYISMINDFRKKGYSSYVDLIIVAIGQVIILISPLWLLRWISSKLLRKVNKNTKK